MLLEIEARNKRNIITPENIAVGIARAGNNNPTLKADYISDLLDFDFGQPPYSLIIPGELHFMEIEALIAFADAPRTFRRLSK
jgi:diphthamide biosynthesis methyltransferase